MPRYCSISSSKRIAYADESWKICFMLTFVYEYPDSRMSKISGRISSLNLIRRPSRGW